MPEVCPRDGRPCDLCEGKCEKPMPRWGSSAGCRCECGDCIPALSAHTLRARVAELEMDKARLDWLDAEEDAPHVKRAINMVQMTNPGKLRKAIDAARREIEEGE